MIEENVLEDLEKECPCNKDEWCFFREVFCSLGWNGRNAEQVRLIDDYKWMESSRLGGDIGFKRATEEFISKHYAEKFAQIYSEGKNHIQLFEELFGIPYNRSNKN